MSPTSYRTAPPRGADSYGTGPAVTCQAPRWLRTRRFPLGRTSGGRSPRSNGRAFSRPLVFGTRKSRANDRGRPATGRGHERREEWRARGGHPDRRSERRAPRRPDRTSARGGIPMTRSAVFLTVLVLLGVLASGCATAPAPAPVASQPAASSPPPTREIVAPGATPGDTSLFIKWGAEAGK